MLTRLASTGTVSDVRRLRTKIGQRDIRLTLQKLDTAADPVAFAMVLLDDITERRALERTISNRPQGSRSPSLPLPRRKRFTSLARCSTNPLPSKSQCRKSRGANRWLFRAPSPLQSTSSAHAVLISKGEQVLHANPKALEIFGYASVDDLINDDAVWTYFSTLGHSVPVATLALESGADVSFAAQLSEVAWHSGPARQFILKPVAAPAAKPSEVKVAPPPPVIAAPVEAAGSSRRQGNHPSAGERSEHPAGGR